MKRSLFAIAIGTAVLAGCASNLDIKVERIQTNGQMEKEIVQVNAFEGTVDRQLKALESYVESTWEMESKLGESKNAITAYTAKARSTAEKQITAGRMLRDSLSFYELTKQVPSNLRSQVSGYEGDVDAFLVDQTQVWNKYSDAFPDESLIGKKIDAEVNRMKHEVLPRAKRLASVRMGYQGFVVDDIFRISASDPNYVHVLKGEPIPEAITSVHAEALGDSTMLFVQENPTQMRIYQVETDVEKLVQNAMFIFDKTLSAAIKYLGPVPAP